MPGWQAPLSALSNTLSSPRCQGMPAHSRSHKALDLCEAPDKLPPHRRLCINTRIVAKSTSVSRPRNPKSMATSGTDGSVAERLSESSVARLATHASHQLRNVACVTSSSSLSLSVGRLAHFSLSPASPPQLRPHLCPSVSLATLARPVGKG